MTVLQASWNEQSLSWSENNNVRGYVKFSQTSPKNPVKVHFYLQGVPPGLHGIHIHEKGMNSIENIVTNNPCQCTSGHYNPTNSLHGYHYGDLCFNIFSDNNGNVNQQYFDTKLTLFPSSQIWSIKNRSIVIHRNKDNKGALNNHKDKESLTTGKAGDRIACAQIT